MKYKAIKYLVLFVLLLASGFFISGNVGATSNDFVILNGVLTKYRGSSGDIIIPNSVVTIGKDAFRDCETITSVIIPDSVTSIGDSAFSNCTNLSRVNFPDSIEAIGSGAFYGTNLYDFSLPEALTNIGTSTFKNTPWFNTMKSKSPMVIINGVLIDGESCSGTVVIPDTVTHIGEEAFYDNRDIIEVIIPNTVTDIGYAAFEGCYYLETVVLPDSLVNIGSMAFSGTGIRSIAIPDSVTIIKNETFSSCRNLVDVSLPDTVIAIGMEAFISCRGLEKITIPGSVTKIANAAFLYCENLKEITFTDNFNASIESNVFGSTPWLTEKRKQNPLIIGGKVVIDGYECTGDVIIPYGILSIADNAFLESKLTSVYIPDSVISIGTSSFSLCYQLEKVRMGSSISHLGTYAFHSSNLSEIKLPDSLIFIGYSAFDQCTKLEDISIPDSVEFIGPFAFSNTPWFKQKQKENPLVIINNILIDGTNCKGYIKIPDGVSSITNYAFKDNSHLTGIYIPSSVTSIGKSAFLRCTSLVSVNMEDSVTLLEENAFSGCSKLTNVKLSNSLNKINPYTFQDCISLKKITLPASLNSIEYSAFYNCTKLSQIAMPNTVTNIIISAFGKCSDKLTIYGYRNSLVQKFAEYNDISFKPIAPYKYSNQILKGNTTLLRLNSGSLCTWKSSNPYIASVDKNGTVTALKEGAVFITGSLYGKTYTFKVIVK